MFVCLGKSDSCRSNHRRSLEFSDISPTKVKQSPGKLDKYRSTNGRTSLMSSSFDSHEGCVRRDSSQSLDINDNRKPWLSKASTLPRRYHQHGNAPPPKPPRLPPKPPRLMERQVFVCENPACRKEENLLGIVELDFKSCPSCFTHYCSLACRREHWVEHKTVCHYERINSHMRAIGDLCSTTDKDCLAYLSDVARDGFTAKGRGAVLLVFLSPRAAELFLESGLEYFRSRHGTLTFSSFKEIKDSGVTTKHQKQLLRQVSEYCPTREFIVNVAIVVGKNLPATPVPRNKAPVVIQQFKIPFKAGFYTECLSPQNSVTNELFSYWSNSRRKSL